MLLLRPSIALVMIGSNDTVERNGLADFRRDLPRVVRAIVGQGVVPVLSTIPPRLNPPTAAVEVPRFNAVIRSVAAAERVPLWNYWLQLHDKRHYGLSYDLLHPAPAPQGGGDFTDAGLAYGFNLRNLGALEVLRHVAAVVLDGGPPDA
jgi:lysophospholipase L1-like esterase